MKWIQLFSKISLGVCLSLPAVAAKKDNYQVNMRVGLKGQAPISVGTVAKSGKKSFISQFSDDGQIETLIELQSRKASQNNKQGLLLDVQVTRRVRGQVRGVEKAQLFAPENQEIELGNSSSGRSSSKLNLAVIAHKI